MNTHVHEAICWVVGAGDFFAPALNPQPGDFVIAADGGYSALKSQGITPDLVLGDFDSLGHIPKAGNVIVHPAEKDDTDMMLAIKQGLAHNYSRIVMLGGLGGRLDHSLANLQSLMFIARLGRRGYLIGENCAVTTVSSFGAQHSLNALNFDASHAGIVSVFCLCEPATGVTLNGLKYSLSDAQMNSFSPLGVSNEFTGTAASVSVQDGTLLVTWSDNRWEMLRQ